MQHYDRRLKNRISCNIMKIIWRFEKCFCFFRRWRVNFAKLSFIWIYFVNSWFRFSFNMIEISIHNIVFIRIIIIENHFKRQNDDFWTFFDRIICVSNVSFIFILMFLWVCDNVVTHTLYHRFKNHFQKRMYASIVYNS